MLNAKNYNQLVVSLDFLYSDTEVKTLSHLMIKTKKKINFIKEAKLVNFFFVFFGIFKFKIF